MNASCTITIAFSQLSLGTRSGELPLRSNATPATNLALLSGTSCRWFSVQGTSSLSDYGNRKQKLATQRQILPIFYVNIEHIDSKMGEIWVVQADFEPI